MRPARRLIVSLEEIVIALAIALVAALSTIDCASAPPNATPRQRQIWQADQVRRNLDLLRDGAVAAHEGETPLISEEATRQVVLFHRTALSILLESPFGWQRTIEAALEQLRLWLPGNERQLLGPYIDLIKVALDASVPRAQ